ncbi:serine O-acetyltransferase [Piscinibacter sp. HJYY11]|uniref:serine O-acetyltransferase n=1 Tax=Piscinibacter sp. HJYY11 TaxID=2801333 RepID=UPI00191D562B|nr:serine O-acetyltransferase [Piscinibacter sp. HJYY11]MBL0729567.1 serine O-acetyltransferase [Piscinibacter sp. HJYY11]
MGAPADTLWHALRDDASQLATAEPVLAAVLRTFILDHPSLDAALAELLARKLASAELPADTLRSVAQEALRAEPQIGQLTRADLAAIAARDPAAGSSVNPFLNHKGFHALQAHRIAHWYWGRQRKALAQCLQGRASEVFAVDIHPAAAVGGGVFIDHGTGVVIGETAVVGDNVSILQGVTLGGTGKETGDRHPKIGRGVLLSAGAKVLGNIRIGDGAKVGAGSVVLDDVPPHKTVVGVPARVVGTPRVDQPALDMDQHIDLDEGG